MSWMDPTDGGTNGSDYQQLVPVGGADLGREAQGPQGFSTATDAPPARSPIAPRPSAFRARFAAGAALPTSLYSGGRDRARPEITSSFVAGPVQPEVRLSWAPTRIDSVVPFGRTPADKAVSPNVRTPSWAPTAVVSRQNLMLFRTPEMLGSKPLAGSPLVTQEQPLGSITKPDKKQWGALAAAVVLVGAAMWLSRA